jgi:hypothetical protein
VGVSNSSEALVGVMMLIDEVRAKMEGTKLAAYPWRPASPEAADDLAELTTEALARCDDATEALIVITAAAVIVAGLRNQTDLH